MRTINYILTVILVIVSFMTVSCNRVKVERRESLQKIVEPSEPIEITNDEIIVLPTTDLFSYKLDAHGLHISDTYSGKNTTLKNMKIAKSTSDTQKKSKLLMYTSLAEVD